MKLSLKAFVAALALTAAGGAFAQTGVASPTGTDMYFYAYDNSTASAFIIDLGSNYSNFDPSTSTSAINIAANSYYNTFASAVTDNSIEWGVFAAANPSVNHNSIDMTSGSSTLTPVKASTIGSDVVEINTLMSGISANISQTAITGGAFTSGQVAQNPQSAIGNLNATLPANTIANAIGAQVSFINYSTNGASSLTKVTPTAFAGTWTFDGTNLDYSVGSVSAVPEPSSYLMMLAGLLMIAALVVRRRNSQ